MMVGQNRSLRAPYIGCCVLQRLLRARFFWLGRLRALFEWLLVLLFRILNFISFGILTFPNGLLFEKVACAMQADDIVTRTTAWQGTDDLILVRGFVGGAASAVAPDT